MRVRTAKVAVGDHEHLPAWIADEQADHFVPNAVRLPDYAEHDSLGRVLSFHTVHATSIMPLDMWFYGPRAEIVRIEWKLLATKAQMAALRIAVLANGDW
jgi:hypothetical protein